VTGNVIWYNDLKKYGFILGDDDRQYFVHITELDSSCGFTRFHDGDAVTFAPVETEKGLKATDIYITKIT